MPSKQRSRTPKVSVDCSVGDSVVASSVVGAKLKSPFRNQSETGLDGLAGRGGCNSKQVFEALLELTCGPRPTERNISARA